MSYVANENRYNLMEYNHCGESGLKLPAVSLGLWHNFGDNSDYNNMTQMCYTAFDNGITHFDLANNYGPQAGSAERNFGKILNENMKNSRSFYKDFIVQPDDSMTVTLTLSTYGLEGQKMVVIIKPLEE